MSNNNTNSESDMETIFTILIYIKLNFEEDSSSANNFISIKREMLHHTAISLRCERRSINTARRRRPAKAGGNLSCSRD